MKTFAVHELVEETPGITITLIPGFGDGYTDVQQDFINGHVNDVVEALREADPSAKIIIASMSTNTTVREAEFRTASLALESDILLHVIPTQVRVAKWRGFHDRVGCCIGS